MQWTSKKLKSKFPDFQKQDSLVESRERELLKIDSTLAKWRWAGSIGENRRTVQGNGLFAYE